MALGDYVQIVYRTGTGIDREKVIARTAGACIEVDMPQNDRATFVEVREVNRGGGAVRTVRFNKNDVVGVIEGHDKPAARTRKVKA